MGQLLFWILFFIIFYTYFGYTLLLILTKLFKKNDKVGNKTFLEYKPTVTVFIAAYNEKEIVSTKVENLRQLQYDRDKLTFLWITDGSNDGTPELLRQYPDMKVFHENERRGKIGAIHRGMKYVESDIVILCDANNMLAPQTVNEVVKCFANPSTGCVAGEKRIAKLNKDAAVGSGEGIYWHYESFIKKLESDVNSVVGAVGELCAIRTNLFEEIEPDSILDDFVISLRIAEKGYKIKYAPEAAAIESSSASIDDEMKRKIRIAAGCLQTLPRLKSLLNPFKHGFFSIQYWSHKVLRWTAVPISLILILLLNIYLVFTDLNQLYSILLFMQLVFYILATIGFMLRNSKVNMKLIFIPYYLLIMNLSIILGFIKHSKGKQSVNWEKAKRN
jgi:cellulose synthase/poly-beta-1,6-N-acetylglucosamine synthase-like glycosyltransferase